AAGRLLVVAGRGNNAGDALIAARELLERHPGAAADVVFAFGTRTLRPLAKRAWRGLSEACRGRSIPTAFPPSTTSAWTASSATNTGRPCPPRRSPQSPPRTGAGSGSGR